MKKVIPYVLLATAALAALIFFAPGKQADTEGLVIRREPWELQNPHLAPFGEIVVGYVEFCGEEYRTYPAFEDPDAAWEAFSQEYADTLRQTGALSAGSKPNPKRWAKYYSAAVAALQQEGGEDIATVVDFLDIFGSTELNREILAFLRKAENSGESSEVLRRELMKMLPYGGRDVW